LHGKRIPHREVWRRNATTIQIITSALKSGTRNPTRKLPEYFETVPTSHGQADPPSEARAKRKPPMRFARAPYHFESHAIKIG
jgi:hypothetical protein